MYFQKDYVLRVIEQFGFFFRRLKEKLELTEQLKDLGAFSREKIGMTPEAALALKDETLNGLLDARSPDDFLACARFFLNGGYYADTEDMVFLAAQTSGKAHHDYYVQQGLALLYNMRVLPDDVLLPGGMSRQDIGESIADLQKMNLE